MCSLCVCAGNGGRGSFKNGSLILLLVLNWNLSSSLSSRHLSKWMPSGQMMASAGENLHCLCSKDFPFFVVFFLFSNLPMDCKGWSHFVLEAFSIFRLFLEALNVYTILKLYHTLLTISYLESEQKDCGVWWCPQELMLTRDPMDELSKWETVFQSEEVLGWNPCGQKRRHKKLKHKEPACARERPAPPA